MRFKTIFLLAMLFISTAQARTLIISDIDDTIKVSHVLDTEDKISRAFDVTTPFTGMAQLYQLLINQSPRDTKIVYLSNAPESILGIPALEISHKTFLSYNNFPAGELDLRESIFDQNHKIDEIRKLIVTERPDLVVLFGDNGERDTEIYHQATVEFGKKVRMISFIHQLYSTSAPFYVPNILAELGKKIFPEQIGYVTPIEISAELKQQGVLTDQSYIWMIRNVGPAIVNESNWKLVDKLRSLSFPGFLNCNDFAWRWRLTFELSAVYDKINARCH